MQSALCKTHASDVTKGLALKVLVTGSTGYVGSRLIAALTNDGHEVSAGLRNLQKAKSHEWPANVRAVRFDVTDMESLKAATAGVDVVVYLVHSMAGDDFVALRGTERQRKPSRWHAKSAAWVRSCTFPV